MNDGKKYSRNRVYFVSIFIWLFILIPLSFYITPLIVILFGPLFYFVVSAISLALGYLFSIFLEKSTYKSKDLIIFPSLLSTASVVYFSFLKFVETIFNSVYSNMISGFSFENTLFGAFLSFKNINVDLIFGLFLIFFNILFLHSYVKASERKYTFFLLYLIPIILYLAVSFLLNQIYVEPLMIGVAH